MKTPENMYKTRPLTWVLLSFLVILSISVLLPKFELSYQTYFEIGLYVFALLVLSIGMYQVRVMNKRLAALGTVAEHVGRGNYLVRSPDVRQDSVGVLAQAVNVMVEKIQHSVEQQEEQQKELEINRKMLEGHNQQLIMEFQRQSEFGAFLSRINDVDVEEVAQNGLSFLASVSDALISQLYVVTEGEALYLAAEQGVDRQALGELKQVDYSSGLPYEVYASKSNIRLERLSGAYLPKVNLGFTMADLMTVIGMPVLFKEEVVGVVVLGLLEDFDSAKERTIQNALEAIGGSLYNANIYGKVQEQAKTLEHVNSELVEADRMRSEFVANMSHELRTPLNSIIGFSTILDKNKNGNLSEKDLSYIEKINRNGKHLLGLINDILDLSKIEAGKMDLEIQSVNLAAHVSETVEMLTSQAEAKHIGLNAFLPEEPLRIDTDPDKLKQVLINLIGNAIKFTESGEVRVATRQIADNVFIDIIDTGLGIAESKLGSIFQPFRQADAGTTRKFGGTGLGLSISKSIVAMLQGDILVSSVEGEGSTFSVRLPLSGEQSNNDTVIETPQYDPPKPPVNQIAENPSRKTVLIIDDDPDARDLLEGYLKEFEVNILMAGNGLDAIEICENSKPDAITLDIMMPGIDGWETLKRLKANKDTRDIPVVVVSIVADKKKAVVLGAMDALSKPVVQDDLTDMLGQYLNKKISSMA